MGWTGYGPTGLQSGDPTDKNSLVAPAVDQQNQFNDTLANIQSQNMSLQQMMNGMSQGAASTGVNSSYNAGTPLNPNTLPNAGRSAGGPRGAFNSSLPIAGGTGKNPASGPFG